MNICVLSELGPSLRHHVGWSISYEFERVLSETTDTEFIYPVKNTQKFLGREDSRRHRFKHRIFNDWFEVNELPTLGKGPNLLLVVGLCPSFLLSLHALKPLLKQFDFRVGYILDGFPVKHIDRSVVPWLDHLFVITSEMADNIQDQLSLRASFLPPAIDVRRSGKLSNQRPIDIIGYGRLDSSVHNCLRTYYNQPDSDRLYFHSTFSNGEVSSLEEHTALMAKLLNRSKISLCFEASYLPRFQGYSSLLYRWFEGWACGCTIVGRKPFGKDVAKLMDWENSAIDIPDDPSLWIPFFEDLLNDEAMLMANARRNYEESCLRHDWRHRIQTMLETLDLPVPEQLKTQISQLSGKSRVGMG